MCGSSCLHFYTRTYTAQMLVHMSVVCSIVLGLIFSFSRVFHNIRSVYLTSFVYNVVSSTTFLASHEISVDARAAQNPAWHWQWDEEGQNIGHYYNYCWKWREANLPNEPLVYNHRYLRKYLINVTIILILGFNVFYVKRLCVRFY